MTTTERLESLRSYCLSPEATPEGVAMRFNALDQYEVGAVLDLTTRWCPLPDDGRHSLMLGDGGEGWSVLWWDKDGRRVIARYDYTNDEWGASWEENPHGSGQEGE